MDLIFEEILIEELQQKRRAAVMIGRLSTPTIGHYKVIDAMKAFIRSNPELHLVSTPIVVIVDGEKSKEDKERNPLTAEDRIKFMRASGRANGVLFLTAPTAIAAFNEVRKNGFEPIAVAAGSDRNEAYLQILDKYFTAKDGSQIKHIKIPGLEREEPKEPDTAMGKALQKLKRGGVLDTAEVSGSLARKAVELGYEEEFAKIVGLEKKPKLAHLMFQKIQAAQGEANG